MAAWGQSAELKVGRGMIALTLHSRAPVWAANTDITSNYWQVRRERASTRALSKDHHHGEREVEYSLGLPFPLVRWHICWG